METPKPRDSLGINQLEYTLLPIGPLDVTRAAILILKQFEKEFPQVRRRSSCINMIIDYYIFSPEIRSI